MSLLQCIEGLPKNTFIRLYEQPATCLAILRLLPSLAKHIVFRLLYIKAPMAITEIEAWCPPSGHGKLHESLRRLAKFNICTDDGRGFLLNKLFQENLHNALVGGGQNASFGQPSDSQDKHAVDIAFLDDYATNAWEVVLHVLVGTPSNKKPKAVMKLMEHSGLMARSESSSVDGQDLKITNKGFQFLLQDVNFQVWAFLLQYLEMADELKMDTVDVLNFLFQLGSLELGQDYSVDALTDTQKQMLDDLKPLGIVYQRKKKSSRFYPTRLATSLTSKYSSSTDSTDSSAGFVIVETNFKVYAYTSKVEGAFFPNNTQNLPYKLLFSVFSFLSNHDLQIWFVGQITRDSVREALSNGISADQIISFLTVHAHPEMQRQTPILPGTVVDQIRLWEMERNRVRVSNGFLYQDFKDFKDYRDLCNYAKDLGYVLWSSDERKAFVVSAEGHYRVREYYTKKKATIN
ncbi:transcription factor Tfb2-domain-containing protein [Chytridium lagenaria]|nr:transcription factor Tfb2-domain-containing protein [Chytridium lagenaria]